MSSQSSAIVSLIVSSAIPMTAEAMALDFIAPVPNPLPVVEGHRQVTCRLQYWKDDQRVFADFRTLPFGGSNQARLGFHLDVAESLRVDADVIATLTTGRLEGIDFLYHLDDPFRAGDFLAFNSRGQAGYDARGNQLVGEALASGRLSTETAPMYFIVQLRGDPNEGIALNCFEGGN